MWVLTEDNMMLNTDNIIYMNVEESDEEVYIKAYFTVSSASGWSDRIYTNSHKFCILDNTEENKNRVRDIFNEIFDFQCNCQKAFNIRRRLK